MKNGALKKILIILLSVSLAARPAGAVFAAPEDGVEINDSVSVSADEAADLEISSNGVEDVTLPGDLPDAVSEESMEEPAGKDVLFANGSLDVELLSTRLNPVEEEIYEEFSALSEEAAGSEYAADRAFFEAENEEEARRIAEEYGAEFVSYCENVGVISFDTGDMNLSDTVMCSLYDGDVDNRIYPDYISEIFDEPESEIDTADPKYTDQWFHDAISDNAAWSTTKGGSVKVAVIDTGISQEHEDLKDNIDGAFACGYDTPEDEHSHGSHCSGIIAAVADNGKGGSGVAPDVKIVSVRAASAGGSLYESDVVAAVNKAVSEGVNVISMSFGSNKASDAEKKALKKAYDKGITLIGSAGNDGVSSKNYPAAFDFVISVASYDEDGGLSYFSNYGDWVDLAAPGGQIYSCAKNGGYTLMSGTSMACPMVSGVVALMYASDPYYTDPANANSSTPEMIKRALIAGCDNNSYKYSGHSVTRGVNAAGAVKYAIGAVKDALVKVETPGKPVMNAAADPRSGAVTVEFSGIEAGTECFYTTDNTAPSLDSKMIASGGKITFSEPGAYTIKAMAVNKAPVSTGYKYASSAVSTLSFKVVIPKKASYEPSELTVRSDTDTKISVIPGGRLTLSGTVSPNNSDSKKVTFELEDTADGAITIDAKGVVKVSRDAAEGAKARIKLGISGKELPEANCDTIEITVHSSVIETLGTDLTGQQEIYTVLPHSENVLTEVPASLDLASHMSQKPGNGVVYKYDSSNKKAAVVDKNGTVRAVGNGKSDIIITAMDGSGKKIRVGVNCMTPVVDMSVAAPKKLPYVKIAMGRSIKLTPVFTGTDGLKPSNRKVTWTSDSENVRVDKKGKVTAAKNAVTGEKATISCISDDGRVRVTASYVLTVKDPVKCMGILKKTLAVYRVYRYWFGYSYRKFLYYKNVYASKATGNIVFTPGQEIDVRTPAQAFSSEKDLVCAAGVKFKTSYDSITRQMETDEYMVRVKAADGLMVNSTDDRGSVETVIPVKAGKYRIIYQAIDGSGKTFTLTIKVR